MKRFIIEYTDNYKGYDYKVVLQSLGHRCGYVILPKGHKLEGKDYYDIPISCHGGLTYGSWEKDRYVIGFDCAHSWDAPDYGALKHYHMYNATTEYLENHSWRNDNAVIKTKEYVIDECKSIIDQLIDMGRKNEHEKDDTYLHTATTKN
jgi:hypothetical protein